MQWIFKIFLAIHKGIYRISGGRIGGKMQGAEVLLLSTIGRKTGKKRVTPLKFIRKNNSFVVVASNVGQSALPNWYYNLQDHSPIEIQIMKKTYTVTATEAEGDQRDQLYQQFISVSDQYARYAENIDHAIPVIILTPTK